MRIVWLILFCCICLLNNALSQTFNYDEAKVPTYTLPNLLTTNAGKKAVIVRDWERIRRPEIIEMLSEEVYGRVPTTNYKVRYKIISQDSNFLKGKAIKKEVQITIIAGIKSLELNLLLVLPKQKRLKAPVFVGLNFFGNQSVTTDTTVRITTSWCENRKDFGVVNNKATTATRGVRVSRWPIDTIVAHGFALATVHYGDIAPDYADTNYGVQSLFFEKNQVRPKPNEWGKISAWAWGYSRIIDYLQRDKDIDKSRIIAIGHSRLGKAALWAAANDKRIKMVVSNNSGCMGAALSKREFGETPDRIATVYPYWFCDNFQKYKSNVAKMPFDQHFLLALMAPRLLYVASAEQDKWADPKGEFLSLVNVAPVYGLYGFKSINQAEMPAINVPLFSEKTAYHIRTGVHDVTLFDWQCYLKFAKQNMCK